MKNWIISQTEEIDTYLIATEKAIWISNQPKGVDIQELIDGKSLGNLKSIRYAELKEIVFIESDFTISLNYIDDNETDQEIDLKANEFTEVRAFFKNYLKGTELKSYSILKQVSSQLIVLGVTITLTALTYYSAQEIENGGTVRTSGRRAWLKKILATIAELLGTTGTLIVGGVIIGILSYFLVKKIQNPKKGEILKITSSPKLSL